MIADLEPVAVKMLQLTHKYIQIKKTVSDGELLAPAITSIAISLKRIADRLDKQTIS